MPLTATPSAKGAENAARAARELMGDWVQLTVNDGGVLLGRASAQERDEARYRGGVNGPKAPPSATLNPRLISDGVECVRLAEAVAERAGRKAATCGDLTRIARGHFERRPVCFSDGFKGANYFPNAFPGLHHALCAKHLANAIRDTLKR